MRRRRSHLFSLLLAAALLLVVVGVVLVAAYFVLREGPELPVAWVDSPWTAIEPDAVNPPLALRTLAGEAPIDAVRAALSVDDLDTAYTTLVFNPSVGDVDRTGQLILLAQRYSAARQPAMVAVCLRQVQSLAVLSVALSDVARADALLQSATLWQHLGDMDSARSGLGQVEVIALGSPYLLPAQRRDVWLRLAESYAALGDHDQAAVALRAADRASTQEPVSVPSPMLPTLRGIMFLPAEAARAREERQQRAVVVIEQWIALDGGDVGPELADLAEFLRREESSLTAHIQEVSEGASELSAQVAAAWMRVDWLTLKYQVASGRIGLTVVAEWEEEAPLIRSELSKAYETLFRLRGDQVTALPDAGDVDGASVEHIREQILFGELQLYPDYPEDQLATRLLEAQDSLRLSRPGGIWIASVAQDDDRLFTLEGGSSQ